MASYVAKSFAYPFIVEFQYFLCIFIELSIFAQDH